MPKVLIADNIDGVCAELLNKAGIEVNINKKPSPEELADIIHNYNGVVVRSATKLKDPKFFEAATGNLKIIGRAGAGVDTIDMDLANKYGIMVVNTPTSNSVSVAELAFLDMLEFHRSIRYADITTKEGKFEKKTLGKYGAEVYGKTVGIIGMGNIGREFAKRATAFGMNIIYTDPFVNIEGYKKVGLEELAEQADIVTIHAPKTSSTIGMITKDFLAKLKPNAVFINTSRAQIIKGSALVDILEKRDDLRVAIDVYEKDEAQEQPLAKFGDRVILTPHIGASTKDAQIRGAEQIAKQFIEFFQYGRAKHSVNFAAIPEELYPFLDLTEKVALMGANLIQTQPNKIEISCYGKLNIHSELLSRAAIKGVLQFNTDIFVNYINAPYLAQEKGIKTDIRTPDEAKGYGDAVTIDLVVDGKRTSIRGNLNYDKQSVISRVDNFLINFIPKDSSVFIYKDAPGVLGVIGTVCGDSGVNIEDITTRTYRIKTQKTETQRYNEETAAMTVVNPALDQTIMGKITQELSHKKVNMYVATNVNF